MIRFFGHFEGDAQTYRAEGEVDEIRARQAERDRAGALAAVSERMIQAIDFIGEPQDVTQFVRAYIEAGIEKPILMPMPWGDDRLAVTTQTMQAAAKAML